MRLPLSWIRTWVDLPGHPAARLATDLTLRTAEVEEVETIGDLDPGIVVARVEAVRPHPHADRLVCATVRGDSGTHEVVCGAPNCRQGQTVAWARPGTRLPGGQAIGPRLIRNVPSEGMLCSEPELGIGEDASGILDLEGVAGAEPGRPLREVAGVLETVLVIDNKSITHRPDLWGLYGFARELAALYRVPLRDLELADLPRKGDEAAVPIRVEDAADCPRYLALRVEGVRVGPSPFLARRRLACAGVRPISGVVDLTNLVMLETGQPLHAFDLRRVREGCIEVRRARAGETMRTLDGVERKLDRDVLVIADGEGPVALAGVMGGEESEVGEETASILLESATFHPALVRRAATRLGIRTEASSRFEKGLDTDRAAQGVRRFLALAASCGIVAEGWRASALSDAHGAPTEPGILRLRRSFLEARLGTPVPDEVVTDALSRLGLSPIDLESGKGWRLTIPPARALRDLTREEDLVEEVGRVIGYGSIPPKAPLRPVEPVPRDPLHELERAVRETLARSLGFDEVLAPSFERDALLELLGVGGEPRVEVLNPPAQDQRRLRRGLVPNLLAVVAANRNTGEEIRIFEVAPVYPPEARDERGVPVERREVAGVLWRKNPPGSAFLELKGYLEEALDRLLVPAGAFRRREGSAVPPWAHPGRCAAVEGPQGPYGRIASLHPRVLSALDLEGEAAVFAFDVRSLLAARRALREIREPPRFPARRVDLSLLVDGAVEADGLFRAIRDAAPPELEEVQLYDIYTGDPIPQGRKSVTFALVFRSASRTLQDEEVFAMREPILEALRASGAELRA